MERLTYRLNEKEEKDMSSKYLHYKYCRVPDYDLDKGNSGRITNDMLYNKLGELEDLEEELDMPLDKAVDLLFKAIKNSEFYDCLTCTNIMHNERGCDGNCSHNRKFSRKELLELLELEEKFRGK